MSKKANVKPNQRQKIVDRRKDGKSYGQIAKALKLSKTACLQAMKYVKANGTCEKKKRTRQRKTTEREDRRIHRLSEENIKPPLIFIQNWRKSLRSRYLSEL